MNLIYVCTYCEKYSSILYISHSFMFFYNKLRTSYKALHEQCKSIFMLSSFTDISYVIRFLHITKMTNSMNTLLYTTNY